MSYPSPTPRPGGARGASRPESVYSQSSLSLSTAATSLSEGGSDTRKRQNKKDEVGGHVLVPLPPSPPCAHSAPLDGVLIHSRSPLLLPLSIAPPRSAPQAIRKKIESELSRKRPTGKGTSSSSRRGPSGHSSARPKQGTVSALRPLPALTVPHSISVADASQLCAAKRTDCVLVVDEDEHLCGIFTAKDLAFRVSLETIMS